MTIVQNSKSKFKNHKHFSYISYLHLISLTLLLASQLLECIHIVNFIVDGVFRFSSPVGLPFYRRKVILQTEKFRFNFKHPLHHFPFKSLPIKDGAFSRNAHWKFLSISVQFWGNSVGFAYILKMEFCSKSFDYFDNNCLWKYRGLNLKLKKV